MQSLIRTTLLAVGLVAGMTGIAAAQPPYPPVPPPRYEAVPPPRGERYVWEPGHWHWTGVQYIWAPGVYVVRRPHYAQYEPGRWIARGGAWVWEPAHWR